MALHSNIGLTRLQGNHHDQHQHVGILDLSSPLRHRIYEHLGICGSPPSGLVDEGGRLLSLSAPHLPEQLPLGFHGLLLSCRLLYHEASRLLYTTSRFTIRFSDRQSLEPLRNLKSSTCAALTYLQVILAETSCHSSVPTQKGYWTFGSPCCQKDSYSISSCERHHRHDEPIKGLDDPRLREWDMTMSYLASTIGTGTMELSVVCDVSPAEAGISAANFVMASLLRLPRLKDCSVRLCQQPNRQLQRLADDTVLRTRHIISPSSDWTPSFLEHPPESSSRILALPRELRLRILSYTDLITPWAEVRWSPQRKGFIVGRTHCENQEFRDQICPPSRHYGCQFSDCYLTFPRPSPGCFCRNEHSGSSSSITCRCWLSPQALFLVCKTLYKDAQIVFYSGNRFVVFDRHSDPPWSRQVSYEDPAGPKHGYPYPRFGASIFLREIVPNDCLRNLCFLELVFPPWDHDVWPREGQAAVQEWKDTTEWAKSRLSVGGLTIRLIAMDASDWEQPASRKYMSKSEGIQIIAGYIRILGPLAHFDELQEFHAQLVSPWRWNEGGLGSHQAVVETERQLKERAEKLVLGNRYPAPDGDRAEPLESVWHHSFARNC